MVLFNYSTKELTAKVVYYGPGLCGKTTNLQWVHEKLPIKNKGKMLSLATETDRTLFFDFLPIEIGTVRGMRTRIQLYTVPGQVFYNATRRMVLKGADAVVFVCDSQEAMLDANLESFENMRQNLEANEIDPDEVPLVLQYNKRDLPNALPIEILNERMNPHNVPFYEAVAVRGVGVEDTLKAVTKLVFKSLSAKYGEGGTASSPPGRAPGPPRAAAPPAPPAPPAARPSTPPPELSAEDLLSNLDAPSPLTPGPMPSLASAATAPPRPAPVPPPLSPPRPPSPPPQMTRPSTPSSLPSLDPAPELRRPASPPGSPIPTSAGRLSPFPAESTLRTSRDEAEELRRRIAAPGIPDVSDEDIDLEEIPDENVTAGRISLTPDDGMTMIPNDNLTTAPDPMMQAEPDGATEAEVEVPIELEVAPGTTRVSLTLKLVLHIKR
jgi:signal recognition particle receptor subunit beta